MAFTGNTHYQNKAPVEFSVDLFWTVPFNVRFVLPSTIRRKFKQVVYLGHAMFFLAAIK